jgi:hypothetical protein
MHIYCYSSVLQSLSTSSEEPPAISHHREVWKEPSIEYELHGVDHANGNAKGVRDKFGVKCWYVPWRFDKELTLELSRRRLPCSFRAMMIPVAIVTIQDSRPIRISLAAVQKRHNLADHQPRLFSSQPPRRGKPDRS